MTNILSAMKPAFSISQKVKHRVELFGYIVLFKDYLNNLQTIGVYHAGC